MLNGALKQHGEDWDLVLFAAREAARFGQRDAARKLIARAEGKAKEVEWLGAAAEVARNEGDTVRALDKDDVHATVPDPLHQLGQPLAVLQLLRAGHDVAELPHEVDTVRLRVRLDRCALAFERVAVRVRQRAATEVSYGAMRAWLAA